LENSSFNYKKPRFLRLYQHWMYLNHVMQ